VTAAGKPGYGKKLDVPNIDTQPLPLKDFTTTVQKGNYVQGRCSASPPAHPGGCSPTPASGQAPDTVLASQACSN
jgi:hypothetical protein